MRRFFAYIRVSTARQGEKGVSLAEQRDAIVLHAERGGLDIVEWFEERQTAAKRGRPVFARMLKLLRQGKAEGVVIHKIDRSARNLKDWADLGELIDGGVEVHFANESLDLQSRGGRLSADIQAVVAADYIRNLREEARKGIIGRLKQGLYPLPAPIGYLDRGKGKPKELAPTSAPLVRRAFELYGTGNWNLDGLCDELFRLGLRNRRGGRVTRSGLSTILNNPFYIGVIRITRTGETYEGIHEPLVSKALFDRVGAILRGKTPNRAVVHGFLFRRLFSCARCGYSLIGERQKGYVYYRCHTKGCPTKTVREEMIEDAVRTSLSSIQLDSGHDAYLRQYLAKRGEDWERERVAQVTALRLNLDRLKDRLVRLTDAYLDGVIERPLLEERKNALLLSRKDIEERLALLEREDDQSARAFARFLELARSAFGKYKQALPEEKRELVKIVTSNRSVEGNNVAIALAQPFAILANGLGASYGGPYRARPRTLDQLAGQLITWFTSHPHALETALITISGQDTTLTGGDNRAGLET